VKGDNNLFKPNTKCIEFRGMLGTLSFQHFIQHPFSYWMKPLYDPPF